MHRLPRRPPGPPQCPVADLDRGPLAQRGGFVPRALPRRRSCRHESLGPRRRERRSSDRGATDRTLGPPRGHRHHPNRFARWSHRCAYRAGSPSRGRPCLPRRGPRHSLRTGHRCRLQAAAQQAQPGAPLGAPPNRATSLGLANVPRLPRRPRCADRGRDRQQSLRWHRPTRLDHRARAFRRVLRRHHEHGILRIAYQRLRAARECRVRRLGQLLRRQPEVPRPRRRIAGPAGAIRDHATPRRPSRAVAGSADPPRRHLAVGRSVRSSSAWSQAC